jgi:hypothetical protein
MALTPWSKLFALSIGVINSVGCIADTAAVRYRGEYTLGHEVHTFCPEINAECYWLSPKTDAQTRDRRINANREPSTTGTAYINELSDIMAETLFPAVRYYVSLQP